MSAPKRVCAFYSVGPHFGTVLRRLAEEHPQAEITALAPPEGPIQEIPAGVVLKRRPARLFALVRQLRSERYDMFAIMFDSPRLRLLAAGSRSAKRFLCTPGGRLVTLRGSLPGVAMAEAIRLLQGHVMYAVVWLAVRLLPVRRGRNRV